MALNKGEKTALIEKYAVKPGDTGSSEVQVAMLTAQILSLNEHLQTHKGDQHGRHGLLAMVGNRRAHLKYLSRKNPASYRDLLQKLGLRK